jgi:hypothetical protein
VAVDDALEVLGRNVPVEVRLDGVLHHRLEALVRVAVRVLAKRALAAPREFYAAGGVEARKVILLTAVARRQAAAPS